MARRHSNGRSCHGTCGSRIARRAANGPGSWPREICRRRGNESLVKNEHKKSQGFVSQFLQDKNMSEEPKNIWKQPLKGPKGFLLWFALLFVGAFAACFCAGLLSAVDNKTGKVVLTAFFCVVGFAVIG